MKRGSVLNRLLDQYIGIPALGILSLLGRRKTCPAVVTRIGVMSSPTLGDTLINSGPIRDIRREYPTARIIFIASQTNVAAARLLPDVDEIVKIELTAPLKTLKTLRSINLDLFFDFTPWQRLTAFYTAYSGAKFRVGFKSQGQHRHWHYDVTADHSSEVHELENFRSLLRAVGATPMADPQVRSLHTLAPDLGSYLEIIVFHPWASGDKAALREWPLENWVELAQRLNRSRTLFVITGGPADRFRSEILANRIKEAGLSSVAYVSPDGLLSLTVLLKSVDLVVSVNTGTMHLAAMVGAPTISLNGPTATHRWGPVGKQVMSIEPHGGGGGYLHLGFEFAGRSEDCMSRIRVNDVVTAAYSLATVLAEAPGVSTSARA